MRKGVMCLLILVSLLSLVQAKIEVSTTQEMFEAGENITLRVTLLDDSNNPIKDNVQITIEDAENILSLEETVPSNELVEVDLGEGVSHGYWSITANYNNEEAKTLFAIEMQELVEFELEEDMLTITNVGNGRYTKTIQIIIGDTMGIRTPKLEMGEQIKYRLVAPEGDYDIKITDGVTTLERKAVQLTGTGQAIGALDARTADRSGITGGISPDEEDDIAILSYMKNNKLIYVFILIVFGVAVLLAIERNFSKKAK